MPVSAPFTLILAAGRSQFNAMVVKTRRRKPGFDTQAFTAFLQSGVNEVVTAVCAAVPERAASVTLIAYDLALTLVGQGLAGPNARNKLVGRTWSELLPLLPKQVAEAPAKVLGALSNAAVYLEGNPGLRGEEWLHHMTVLAKQTRSASELLDLGKILAWRSGAAHFRAGALTTADQLPEALAAVGASPGTSWAEVHNHLQANPWWSPEQNKEQVKEVGSFTGLGGVFSQPPQVRASVSGFWVKSGVRYHLLVADTWGAVLHQATQEEFQQAPPPVTGELPVLKGNKLVFAHRSMELDLPAEGLNLVCNQHTAALTSPYTHAIRLFPLQ